MIEDQKSEIALLDSRAAVEKYLGDTKAKIDGLLISSQDSVNLAQETIRVINKAVERAEEIRKKENIPAQTKIDENNNLYKPIVKGLGNLKDAINEKLKAFSNRQAQLRLEAEQAAAARKRAQEEDALETAILGIWKEALGSSYNFELGEHTEDFLQGISELKKTRLAVPDIPGAIKTFFVKFAAEKNIAYEVNTDHTAILKKQEVQESLAQAAVTIQQAQTTPVPVQTGPAVKLDGRLNRAKYSYCFTDKDGNKIDQPDMALIPALYAIPNEKLLQNTANSTKGSGIVPGVKFYKEA